MPGELLLSSADALISSLSFLHRDRNVFDRYPERKPTCDGRPTLFYLWVFHGDFDVYRRPNGYECAYDDIGELIDSGPHLGTFDFVSPQLLYRVPGHILFDVLPGLYDSAYTPNLTTRY